MTINEESIANSKLKDFISHIPELEQKSIKSVLNSVYLYFKHNNLPYEEVSKPNKAPYHGAFTKIAGAKDIDQLSWKLKVTLPLNYGGNNKAVYSLYIIYDTQLIMGNVGIEYSIDDYCFAALNLYIDMNL